MRTCLRKATIVQIMTIQRHMQLVQQSAALHTKQKLHTKRHTLKL